MNYSKFVKLSGLVLFLSLMTLSSPSHAGVGTSVPGNAQLAIILAVGALLAFGFQMAYNDEDVSGWRYPYKDNIEKIRQFRDEIEKWNPSSGPLYDASDYGNVYWIQIATNFMGKKDELIKSSYNDYPKGEAAHPITRATFATLDQLTKVIEKKGGPGKLYKPSQNAIYWSEKINEASKELEAWDGVQPFSQEQFKFVKAALDEKERELWMDYENKRYNIGFHSDMVYAAFDKMAKVAEKKGGKSILEDGAPIDFVLKFVLDEIIECTKVVKEFDPKTKIWTARAEWVWRAISPGDRESWAGPFFNGFADQKPRFYRELDKLAAAFDEKVHLLVPGDGLFKYHNKEEEEMMKGLVGVDEIFAIGIEQKEWEIQYEDEQNKKWPKHKIKNGYIWGRDKEDDTPYCRLYQFSIMQQHEGDGKYGATIVKYFNSWPRPWPEGKSKGGSKASAKPAVKAKAEPKAKTATKEKAKSDGKAKPKTKKK